MNHLLCSLIQYPPTQDLLTRLITQHPQLTIAFNNNVICFSSNESTTLTVLSQELKNEVYSGFFKDSYEMMAQTEEQIQLFLKDLVKINSKEEINKLFLKDSIERQKLIEASKDIDQGQTYYSKSPLKKSTEEISIDQYKNETIQKKNELQISEQRKRVESYEDDLIKKVELQFQSSIGSEKCSNISNISQTKLQPNLGKDYKSEFQKQIVIQVSSQYSLECGSSIQIQCQLNQFQVEQKQGNITQIKLQEESATKIVEQMIENKDNDAAQKHCMNIEVQSGNPQVKQEEVQFHGSLKQQKTVNKRSQRFSLKQNGFTILLLVTWIFLLLLIYS